MKSKAVIFTGKNQMEFGEVETPLPGPRDVLVNTKYSWISNGTEGSLLRCERYDGITPWQPYLPLPYPMVPGYQKVGVVESIGGEVQGFKEGQWVFVTTTKTKDTHRSSGGHIRRGPSDVSQVYAIPEGDDPVKYAGLVLTQVGYNTGVRPPVEGGCHALVVGDGMVGHWAAQTLQMRGAKVALVGKHDFRLQLFQRCEGDLTLKAQEAHWLDEALEWAGGEFDIVVDTVGNEVNYDLNLKLIPLIRREGHYVTTGHEGNKAWMDLKLFIYREATIHLPAGWTRPRLEKTLKLVHEGKLQTLPLITHRMPVREVGEAWKQIFEQKDSTLGIILEWDK